MERACGRGCGRRFSWGPALAAHEKSGSCTTASDPPRLSHKRPHGPAPRPGSHGEFLWDDSRGCWVSTQGEIRYPKRRARPDATLSSAPPPPPVDDGRPWDAWFAGMVDLARQPMTAADALTQADSDGLVLQRSSARRECSTSETHCGWKNVSAPAGKRASYQAYVQMPTHFCHITNAPTAEEAALYVARFCAYPLGLDAAETRLLGVRRVRTEASEHERNEQTAVREATKLERAIARADAKAQKDEAEARKSAEAAKVAATKAEKAVEAEASKKEAEARKAEAKAKGRAEEVAKAQAAKTARAQALRDSKQQLEQHRRQLAAQQAQMLREAAAEAAARRLQQPRTAPSATTRGVPPAPATAADPLDALVQQVLGSGKNPWRCLGLEPGAPQGVVRKRYLMLALRLHPDKATHPRAHEAFAALECAYRDAAEWVAGYSI